MRFVGVNVMAFAAQTHREDVIGENSCFAPGWRERHMKTDTLFVGQHFDPRETVGISPYRVIDSGEIDIERAAPFLEEMR